MKKFKIVFCIIQNENHYVFTTEDHPDITDAVVSATARASRSLAIFGRRPCGFTLTITEQIHRVRDSSDATKGSSPLGPGHE